MMHILPAGSAAKSRLRAGFFHFFIDHVCCQPALSRRPDGLVFSPVLSAYQPNHHKGIHTRQR